MRRTLLTACFATAFSILSLPPADCSANITFSRPTGVYSLTGVDQPTAPAVYRNANVAGVAVRASWAGLEPNDGVYSWSYLDNEVANAKAAGKKVSLYIAVSNPHVAPAWVYAAGAKYVNTSNGQTPVPWDPVFLKKWHDFVAALGARYSKETTLSYVRGATEALTDGWNMPSRDALLWSAVGYTDAKILGALQTSIADYETAFPNTYQWGEVGNLNIEKAVTGNVADYVSGQIGMWGLAGSPYFGVWREDLDVCISDPPSSGFWTTLWDSNGRAGAQMIWSVRDGTDGSATSWRMNPCQNSLFGTDDLILEQAINIGLNYKMPYVEIYQVDVLDPELQTVLAYAAANLR
jgi:hypothetical protein